MTANTTAPVGRIAYLNSRYPALSHTFIEREIREVRRHGIEVVPFSVRPATNEDQLGEQQRNAATETAALLDNAWRLLSRAMQQMLRHPWRALRSIVSSQVLSPPGMRQRLAHFAYVLEAARLAWELRRRGLAHVHVHMANNGASVAMLACVLEPSLTYSLSVHGSAEFFNVESCRLARKAEGAMFVRCISHFCRSQIMAWTRPSVWSRFHIVRCAVELPEHDMAPLAAAGCNVSIIAVGRLHPIKGYSVLLHACRALSDAHVNYTLHLIGDGPERDSLVRFAEGLGIADRVVFHGATSPAEIDAALAAADIMVLSSFMEGVPVVLMEAMARGLPVVATRVGGVSELVQDGRSGSLVSPGSPEELADALRLLIEHPELRDEMGRHGRERVDREYNLRNLGEQMVSLFRIYGLVHSPGHATCSVRQPHERVVLADRAAALEAIQST